MSDDDATVKKLLTIRNEYLAHRGSQHVRKGTATLPELQRDEIAALMKRALDLLGKYRDRLEFPMLLWGNHAVQDFKKLLPVLRAGRQSSA